MTKQFVQGDVMFIQRKKKPSGKKTAPRQDSRLVLARGEKTGHDHTVDSATTTLFGKVGDGNMAIVVVEPTQVLHQEHPPLGLEPGYYDVVVQRQYVPEAPKREATQYWD